MKSTGKVSGQSFPFITNQQAGVRTLARRGLSVPSRCGRGQGPPEHAGRQSPRSEDGRKRHRPPVLPHRPIGLMVDQRVEGRTIDGRPQIILRVWTPNRKARR